MKSVTKSRFVAQKQFRVAVSAQKIARKTSVKKTRKTSIERKKAFKKYKIKRKNEKTNSDDESTRQDFNIDHIINKKKNNQSFARNSTNAKKHELDHFSTFF